MKVIAISGKARSGKDTLGEILRDQIKNSVTTAFANKLKYQAHALGWDYIKDAPGRKLLQNLGEVIREYNKDYWVNSVIATIKPGYALYFDCVIITDCRYIDEIETLKKHFDTTTIRMERFGYNNGLTAEQQSHSSETELDTYDFDYVIHNNSDIAALQREAEYISNLENHFRVFEGTTYKKGIGNDN